MNIQNAAVQLRATFKKVAHTNVHNSLNTPTESVSLDHYYTTIITVTNTYIRIHNGGYKTNTTKKFINKALFALNIDASISQRKGVWYLSFHGVETVFSNRGEAIYFN